jgi:hypothetical protein
MDEKKNQFPAPARFCFTFCYFLFNIKQMNGILIYFEGQVATSSTCFPKLGLHILMHPCNHLLHHFITFTHSCVCKSEP